MRCGGGGGGEIVCVLGVFEKSVWFGKRTKALINEPS